MAHALLSPAEAENLRRADYTYDEVGATQSHSLPDGYSHLCRDLVIGAGSDRFAAAATALLGWEMHRRAGLKVRPSDQPLIAGSVAVLQLGVAGLGISAPVRVLHRVDEPRQQGFAYGTLPGHPESGEESFIITHEADDTVRLTIRAFSSPMSLLARLGGPLSRRVQSWVTDRYLRSL